MLYPRTMVTLLVLEYLKGLAVFYKQQSRVAEDSFMQVTLGLKMFFRGLEYEVTAFE